MFNDLAILLVDFWTREGSLTPATVVLLVVVLVVTLYDKCLRLR